MKSFNYIKIFSPFILFITLLGCGKANIKMDSGFVRDSLYKNDYLGLSISLPDEWYILSKEEYENLMDSGTELFYGDDQELQDLAKASIKKTYNLFTIFQYPPGTPVLYNPSLICSAENIESYPDITDGSVYLYHLKNGLLATQVEYKFVDERIESINNTNFYILNTEANFFGVLVKQEYYAIIIDNYVVVFILSYKNNDEVEFMREIIQTVRFE